MKFEYQLLSMDSELVKEIKQGSSGVAIEIAKYEQLENLLNMEDGFYLVKGTKQIVEKCGVTLYITHIDDETTFVDELNISFFH